MRIRLNFSLKNGDAILPFYHQEEILNCISFLLEKNGFDLENRKNFTFSSLKGGFKAVPGGMEILFPKINLVISGSDFTLIEKVKDVIFLETEIFIGSLILQPVSFMLEQSVEFEKLMKYLCLSPICVGGNGQSEDGFIHPAAPLFSDLLYFNTMERMESTGLYSQEELDSFSKFQIVPEGEYLNKYLGMEHKYSRNYKVYFNKKLTAVKGYIFPFTFYAHPKVQEFIYYNGLGLLNEQGWGMLDSLKEKQPVESILPASASKIRKRESVILESN